MMGIELYALAALHAAGGSLALAALVVTDRANRELRRVECALPREARGLSAALRRLELPATLPPDMAALVASLDNPPASPPAKLETFHA